LKPSPPFALALTVPPFPTLTLCVPVFKTLLTIKTTPPPPPPPVSFPESFPVPPPPPVPTIKISHKVSSLKMIKYDV